jgi:hypothetical protein
MKALVSTLALLILNQVESSGNGADANIAWYEPGCDMESSTGFGAGNYVNTDSGTGSYVNRNYLRYYDCSGNKATQTYVHIDDDATPPMSVVIGKNLKRASVSITFPAWIETSRCVIECEIDIGEDGQTTKSCYPMDCKLRESPYAELTLEATLVGTGTPTSTDNYRTRNATISAFTLTVRGKKPMSISFNGDKSASIFTFS